MVVRVSAENPSGQLPRPVFSVAMGPADGPRRRPTARMPAIVSMPLPTMQTTNVTVALTRCTSCLHCSDDGESTDDQDEEYQHHESESSRRRMHGRVPREHGEDHD